MKTTEPAAAAKRRKPGPRGVVLASAALFLVLLVFLSQRVAAGTDPVLGAPRRLAAQPLVVHRIVKRVIVETTVHSRSHAAATYSASPVETSQQSSEPAAAAPVTRSS